MHDLPSRICITPIDPDLFRGHYTVAGCPPEWLDANGFLTGLMEILPALMAQHQLERTISDFPPFLYGYWVNRRAFSEQQAAIQAMNAAGTGTTLRPSNREPIQTFKATLGRIEQTTETGSVEIQPHTLYVRDRHGVTVEGWDRMVDLNGTSHWVKVMETKTCYPTPSSHLAPSQRKLLWKRLGRFLAARWAQLDDPKPAWDEVAVDTGMETRPRLAQYHSGDGEAFARVMSRGSLRREQEMYCEIMQRSNFTQPVIVEYLGHIRTMLEQLLDQADIEIKQSKRTARRKNRG